MMMDFTLKMVCVFSVAALLMAGAKPNGKSTDGQTPLAIAEAAGNTAAAESLVERGAFTDDTARYGRSKEKWTAASVENEDKQPTRRKEPAMEWCDFD